MRTTTKRHLHSICSTASYCSMQLGFVPQEDSSNKKSDAAPRMSAMIVFGIGHMWNSLKLGEVVDALVMREQLPPRPYKAAC